MDKKEREYTDINQELQDAALAVAGEQQAAQAAAQGAASAGTGTVEDLLKNDAMAAVAAQQQAAPAAKPLTYQEQLKSIYSQIQNQQPFSYNLNADPLYQQYKDQYVGGGRLAMKDTIGQAAALTGGYGNTYGQQAGQQAYNAYLQNLSAVIPNLYSLAYDMYRTKNDDLMKRYNWLLQNPPPVTATAGGGRGGGRGAGNTLGTGAVAGAAAGLGALLGAAGGKTGTRSEIEAAKAAGYTTREIMEALLEQSNTSGVNRETVLGKTGVTKPDWSTLTKKK